jgi:hypothetical protein
MVAVMVQMSKAGWWMLALWSSFVWLGLTRAEPGPTQSTNAFSPSSPITVHADGSITRVVSGGDASSAGRPRTIRYQFGLPAKPPVQRWLEQGSLPICHSRWEQDGIRYTQSVLLTRLADGALEPGGMPAADSVLLVQLVGENTASEYTEAKAALGITRGEQILRLELNENLVQEVGAGGKTFLGAIEIPAGGVAAAEGWQLRFHGSMPPGTSGAMTFKYPLTELSGEKALDPLRFMDFTEELRRVRQYWQTRIKDGGHSIFPVVFSPAEP